VLRLPLLLALVVCACGSSAPPPPAGEAKQTVQRYFAAFARGDAAGMCREMTAETRKDAVARAHASSCVDVGGMVVNAVPSEIRERLRYTTVGTPRLDGGIARVEIVGDDMYTEKPDHSTVKLEARDGAWQISGLPWGADEPDEVTTCVMGGIESFDKGDVDPSWKREGRETYDVFLSRLCKRVHAEHIVANPDGAGDLPPSERRAISKLALEVVDEMRRDGLLSTD
jgi:hypothetical protein